MNIYQMNLLFKINEGKYQLKLIIINKSKYQLKLMRLNTLL